MKIFLLRHSETLESLENIILWHLPWNLSKKWILQSEKIWKFLKNENFQIKKIFSSDLKRAKNTTEIINNFLNLEIKFLKILRERKAWNIEWKKENEINWEKYEKKDFNYRKHFWWENFLQVKKRAKKFLKKIRKNEKKNILVVSHSVFILLLIWIIKNISIKESLKINIKNKIISIDLKNKKVEFLEF